MTRATDPAAAAVRLLVAAPNWLGDAVMTSPLLDLLAGARDHRDRPPTVILAIRRRWAPLFKDDPRVAEILPMARTGRHRGVAGLWRLAADWRRARCAGVVLGPPSLRMGLVARLAGLRHRAGYRTDGRGVLLNHGLAVPRRGEWHHADELTELGRTLLAAVDLSVPGMPLVPDILPGCAQVAPFLAAGPPVWILAPGATYGEAKVWPLGPAAAFVAEAVRTAGRRVVVLGDAQAAAVTRDLTRESGVPCREEMAGGAGLVDLAGKTNLMEAVSFLKGAEAFVGNDSGLMHLAGALGVPTVGIFGSSNPDWTAPRGPRTAVVAADGFPCRPCYLRRCDQPVFCLDQVPASRVMSILMDLLDRPPKEG
ncbi:MAG: lipopolysaccharide heptosyltransferase II [bacterium]|nr:lipopolysaccharide heptosyltransferase II [bacterium]